MHIGGFEMTVNTAGHLYQGFFNGKRVTSQMSREAVEKALSEWLYDMNDKDVIEIRYIGTLGRSRG